MECDYVNCRAIIRDSDRDLCVDTTFVQPFNAEVNSSWMFIGEIHFDNGSLPLLHARASSCWNQINLDVYANALALRRRFLHRTKKRNVLLHT